MRGLVVALVIAVASPAAADGRVALVDTSRLFASSGIGAWVAARAKLDAEEPHFKVVESPDGQKPDPHNDISDPHFRKVLTDLERDSARGKAWNAHESEVLDPIEADVMRALDKYAQAHGIAIVLDRAKLADAVLVVAPGADITDAFIKDYNGKKAASSGVNKVK